MVANHIVYGGTIALETVPHILFPMVQSDDHITGDVGCTFSVAGERSYSIAGAAFTNHTETCTHRSDGMYDMKLTAAMTASDGLLVLRFFDASESVDITLLSFMVQPIAQVGSAMTLSSGAITSTAIASNAITSAKVAAGAIHSTAVAADAINAAALKIDACQKVADYQWDEAYSGHVGAGTFGKLQQDTYTKADGTYTLAASYLDYAISDISSEVDTVGVRIPAALVGGKMDSNVGTITNNAITAASIATGAIAAGKIGGGAITVTEAPALDDNIASRAAPGDLMGLSTSAITSAKFAAGAITAAAFAAGAISSTVAPNLDAAISTRAATGAAMALSATGQTNVQSALTAQGLTSGRAAYLDTVNTNLNTTVSSRAAPGDLMGLAAGAITSAKFATDAIAAATVKADAVTKIQAGLSTSAEIAALNDVSTADITTTLTNQGLTSTRAAYLDTVNTNLDAKVSLTATATALSTVDGKLPTTLIGGRIDASVGAMATGAISDAAIATEAVTKLADGNWDSPTSGITGVGSIGKLVVDNIDATISGVNTNIAGLNDISTTDVTTTLTNQGLTSDRAGYLDLVNTNLNATIDSRASSTAVATVDGKLPAALVSGRIDASVGAVGTGVIVAGSFGPGAITSTVAPNLDTNVGSRAIPGDEMGLTPAGKGNVQDAMTAQGMTVTRAGYIDHLDADITTRAAPGDNMGVVDGTLTTAKFGAGAINVTVAPNLDAAITSRAIPGDNMGIVDGTLTTVKFGVGAINETVAPNLDAAITSRAAPTDIVSDGVPFLGANIDDTITSRAVPGDLMGITEESITSVESALYDAVNGCETDISIREALRIILSVCAGKTTMTGTSTRTIRFRDTRDTKDRVTVQMIGSDRVSVILIKT